MARPNSTPSTTPSPAALWVVEQVNLWGDYGQTLVSGYVERPTDGGPLSVIRAGPFLPPISFPYIKGRADSAVILSPDLRESMASLNAPGVSFRPAAVAVVVPIAWETWDRSARVPAEYPDNGEPENYLWDRPNDPATAARLPAPWELVAPIGPVRLRRVELPDGGYANAFESDAVAGDLPTICWSRAGGYLVVDDSIRRWLEAAVGPWVQFSPVRPASAVGGTPGAG